MGKPRIRIKQVEGGRWCAYKNGQFMFMLGLGTEAEAVEWAHFLVAHSLWQYAPAESLWEYNRMVEDLNHWREARRALR